MWAWHDLTAACIIKPDVEDMNGEPAVAAMLGHLGNNGAEVKNGNTSVL